MSHSGNRLILLYGSNINQTKPKQTKANQTKPNPTQNTEKLEFMALDHTPQ